MIDINLVGENTPTYSSPHITLVQSRLDGGLYAAILCFCDGLDLVLLLPIYGQNQMSKVSYNDYLLNYLCIDSNTLFIISNTNL